MSATAEQRTAEWFASRAGKVTASRVADVMARTQKGWGASRDNYRAQLIAERLSGVCEQGFSNAAMQWGVEQEAAARECYCFTAGVSVCEVGFIEHPTIAWAGASPDGLVGDDGLVEIKAPNTATHIATLTDAPIADKYVKQMQFQMACTGRAWCDFVSYDPRLPVEMQLHVARVMRDDAEIAEMEAAIVEFLGEVEATVASLTERYRKAA